MTTSTTPARLIVIGNDTGPEIDSDEEGGWVNVGSFRAVPSKPSTLKSLADSVAQQGRHLLGRFMRIAASPRRAFVVRHESREQVLLNKLGSSPFGEEVDESSQFDLANKAHTTAIKHMKQVLLQCTKSHQKYQILPRVWLKFERLILEYKNDVSAFGKKQRQWVSYVERVKDSFTWYLDNFPGCLKGVSDELKGKIKVL